VTPYYDVFVVDEVPSEFRSVEVVQGPCIVSGNYVECEIPVLDPGASSEIVIRAILDVGVPGQEIDNYCTATSQGTFTVCQAKVRVGILAFGCTKEATLDGTHFHPVVPATGGQLVGFRIRVVNLGDVDLFDLEVDDWLPPELEDFIVLEPACQIVGNHLQCVIDVIPAGGSWEVVVAARVASGLPPGSVIVNEATVTGPLISSCSAIVEYQDAGVLCERLSSLDPLGPFTESVMAAPGDTVYFQVVVTNTGSADLREARVASEVSPIFEDVETEEVLCVAVGNIVECELGALAPGDSHVIHFRARVRLDASPGEYVDGTVVDGETGVPENPGDPVQSQCFSTVDVTDVNPEPPAMGCPVPSAGSVLIFPYVDSNPHRATVISVTNTLDDRSPCDGEFAAGDVLLHFFYFNGSTCLEFDRFELLTPGDTLTVVAWRHAPGFREGFLVVFALDPDEENLRNYDHLVGQALVIEADLDLGWSYNPAAFSAIAGDPNPCSWTPVDVDGDGSADFDGVEYGEFPGELVVPTFFEQDGSMVTGRLAVMSTAGAYLVNDVTSLIYNNDEVKYSQVQEFTCWSAMTLEEISPVTGSLNGDPDETGFGMETGWLRIKGRRLFDQAGEIVVDPDTGGEVIPPILGVLMQRLGTDRANFASGDLLWGIGEPIDGLQLPYVAFRQEE
jgi:hypothetical protein